jgi:hypothetical protein
VNRWISEVSVHTVLNIDNTRFGQPDSTGGAAIKGDSVKITTGLVPQKEPLPALVAKEGVHNLAL